MQLTIQNAVPLLKRFLPKFKINTETNCWEWQRCTGGFGYGYIAFNKRAISAHRISYLLYIGEIPDGKVICHKCDNPPCCNPFHLFLGTKKDNGDDARSKGRMNVAKCPSLTMYGRGCRCDGCVSVNSEYSKIIYNLHRENVNERRRERWKERVQNGEVKYHKQKRYFVKT